MDILSDGKHFSIFITVVGWVIALRTFHNPPAVIFAARAVKMLKIDLFKIILSNVSDKNVARLSVEGEAPRISQPVGPYLSCIKVGVFEKGVVCRNTII